MAWSKRLFVLAGQHFVYEIELIDEGLLIDCFDYIDY